MVRVNICDGRESLEIIQIMGSCGVPFTITCVSGLPAPAVLIGPRSIVGLQSVRDWVESRRTDHL